MTFQQIPPTSYVNFLSLLGRQGFYSEGVFLGTIDGIDAVGENIAASVVGSSGNLYFNNERNLDYDLSVASISGEFAPIDYAPTVLVSSDATVAGDVVYDDATAKLTFGRAGTYWASGACDAVHPVLVNAGVSYGLGMEQYSSVGVLKHWHYSGYFDMASNSTGSNSFSQFVNFFFISADDYIIIKSATFNFVGGLASSGIPTSTALNILLQECYPYG